jgi:hypothetical protein
MLVPIAKQLFAVDNFFFLLPICLLAQTISVRGKITNQMNQALSGAVYRQ